MDFGGKRLNSRPAKIGGVFAAGRYGGEEEILTKIQRVLPGHFPY